MAHDLVNRLNDWWQSQQINQVDRVDGYRRGPRVRIRVGMQIFLGLNHCHFDSLYNPFFDFFKNFFLFLSLPAAMLSLSLSLKFPISNWTPIEKFNYVSFYHRAVTVCDRAVKRASPSGFGLALMGFELNGPGQKSPGLNGPRKLRT